MSLLRHPKGEALLIEQPAPMRGEKPRIIGSIHIAEFRRPNQVRGRFKRVWVFDAHADCMLSREHLLELAAIIEEHQAKEAGR